MATYKSPEVEAYSNLNSSTLITFRIQKGIKLTKGDIVIHTEGKLSWEVTQVIDEKHPSFKPGHYQVCCHIKRIETLDEANIKSLATNPTPNEQN